MEEDKREGVGVRGGRVVSGKRSGKGQGRSRGTRRSRGEAAANDIGDENSKKAVNTTVTQRLIFFFQAEDGIRG